MNVPTSYNTIITNTEKSNRPSTHDNAQDQSKTTDSFKNQNFAKEKMLQPVTIIKRT